MSSGSSVGNYATYIKKKRLERSGLEVSVVNAQSAPFANKPVESPSILRNSSALNSTFESEKENEPPKKVTKSPVKNQFYSLRKRGKTRVPFQEIEIVPNEPSFDNEIIEAAEIETNENRAINALVLNKTNQNQTNEVTETYQNQAVEATEINQNQDDEFDAFGNVAPAINNAKSRILREFREEIICDIDSLKTKVLETLLKLEQELM